MEADELEAADGAGGGVDPVTHAQQVAAALRSSETQSRRRDGADLADELAELDMDHYDDDDEGEAGVYNEH